MSSHPNHQRRASPTAKEPAPASTTPCARVGCGARYVDHYDNHPHHACRRTGCPDFLTLDTLPSGELHLVLTGAQAEEIRQLAERLKPLASEQVPHDQVVIRAVISMQLAEWIASEPLGASVVNVVIRALGPPRFKRLETRDTTHTYRVSFAGRQLRELRMLAERVRERGKLADAPSPGSVALAAYTVGTMPPGPNLNALAERIAHDPIKKRRPITASRLRAGAEGTSACPGGPSSRGSGQGAA
jgi:hypothetical protein